MPLKKEICKKCRIEATKLWNNFKEEDLKEDSFTMQWWEKKWEQGNNLFGLGYTGGVVYCTGQIIENLFLKPLMEKFINFLGKEMKDFSDDEKEAILKILGEGSDKFCKEKLISIESDPPIYCPFKKDHYEDNNGNKEQNNN